MSEKYPDNHYTWLDHTPAMIEHAKKKNNEFFYFFVCESLSV